MSIKRFFTLALLITLTACGGSARSEDIAPAAPPTAVAVVTPPPAETAASPSTPAATSEAVAAGPVLVFTLSGGIVGFCDELSLDAAGGYLLRRSCAEPAELSGVLAPPDLASLQDWTQNLAGFQLNFEDNPGGPDSLASTLTFSGQGSAPADEAQQRVIFDWANSLLVRIRPQPAPPPTPEPIVIGPEGLCPDLARPAALVIDFERPGGVVMVDPGSGASCNFQLSQPPYGRIATAEGQIYYAVYEPEAKTVTVWQLSPTGAQTPLPFTSVDMAEFGPYNFTVSADGGKIAWSRAVISAGADPPLYRSDLRVAGMDGSNQIVLLEGVEQPLSYIEPIRFSADQGTLYYAVQPDGLGGAMFSFSGRYNSVYSLPVNGGEPRPIFTCPEDQAICVGDVSSDGVLAYVQTGQGVTVLGSDGQPLAAITPPATDFIGSPVFGPTGNLAFVSATLVQANEQELPRPNPGAISLVTPPYTGEVKTLVSDNSVTMAWEWLDENRLLYGTMDEAANLGTAVVTLDGQTRSLSPNFALAVLR